MNNEQKEWSNQYTTNLGVNEVFRLGCAMVLWYAIGFAIFIAINNIGIFVILLGIKFSFLSVAIRWQPAYTVLHKILGNKNIPSHLVKREQKRWSFIPLALRMSVSIIIIYAGIKILFQ